MAYTNPYGEYDTESLVEQLAALTKALQSNLGAVPIGERQKVLRTHLRVLDETDLDTIIYLGAAAEQLRRPDGY